MEYRLSSNTQSPITGEFWVSLNSLTSRKEYAQKLPGCGTLCIYGFILKKPDKFWILNLCSLYPGGLN